MTKPADQRLKQAIDEVVDPQIEAQQTYMPYVADKPFPVSRADLIYVWDQYGTQYLDFTASALPLGHRDPAIQSGFNEQWQQYSRVGASGDHVLRMPVEYAKALSDSLTWLGDDPLQVYFTPDEDSAFSVAMSLAQRVTNRVFLETKTDEPRMWGDVAALVVHLIDKTGKPVYPPAVQAQADDARRSGALVIVDESETGFGRCGAVWSQHQWGIKPDITVVGGPAGGGFPFGAVVAPRRLWEVAEGEFRRQHYAGHPVIATAGLSVLNRLTETLMENVTETGKTLHESLGELESQFPEILSGHRGAGLYQTIETHEPYQAERLVADARSYGLLLPKANGCRIKLMPPLVISELELRRAVDIIAGACLDQAEDDETT
ncbi:aminotransferase [Mycobacterium phage Myrna]|uniref:Aminotransferase n=1 Tax=Mycobacterium phage Myrna TaxID=546805 RepID=B5LJF5_9CAUD|nr:aminotransferase [Mycobacterium phage Myrna]ACH62152.1 aminotransferase [Mycobacterium phage Myrna]